MRRPSPTPLIGHHGNQQHSKLVPCPTSTDEISVTMETRGLTEGICCIQIHLSRADCEGSGVGRDPPPPLPPSNEGGGEVTVARSPQVKMRLNSLTKNNPAFQSNAYARVGYFITRILPRPQGSPLGVTARGRGPGLDLRIGRFTYTQSST